MRESGTTSGWFTIGISLILLGGSLYGLLIFLGIGFAISEASDEAGAPLWGVLLIPGLVGLGFLVLLAKVIVDRLSNEEDNHYSKNVDQ